MTMGMSENMKEMIRRKNLMKQGTDEAEQEADQILEKVLQNGGLTTEEVYGLMAY